jgi:uncharacterized protein Smg (DUF494 family)
MDPKIIEIVLYLSQQAAARGGDLAEPERYMPELKTLGFTDEEVAFAHQWLRDEMESRRELRLKSPLRFSEGSRHLHPTEKRAFEPDGEAVLHQLIAWGLLSDVQVEALIARALYMAGEPLNADEVRELAAEAINGDPEQPSRPEHLGWLLDTGQVH